MKPSSKGRTLTRLCALAAVLALAVVSSSAAQDVTTQFWPEIDTFIRLNERMRIYVPISKTREGTNNSAQDGTVGVYLDYYASPIANRFLLGPRTFPACIGCCSGSATATRPRETGSRPRTL